MAAMKELPPAQQMVIALREIGAWTSDDVAEALGISQGNQRVLLHRARARMRTAVERYYGAVEPVLPDDDDVGGVTPAGPEGTGQTPMEPET
jgi:hypothetical protein